VITPQSIRVYLPSTFLNLSRPLDCPHLTMHLTATTSLGGTRILTFTTGTTGNINFLLSAVVAIVLAWWVLQHVNAEDETTVDVEVTTPDWLKEGWLEAAEVLEVPEIKVSDCVRGCVFVSWRGR
jgi:hypothetical protein